jgi:hypothetical protein
VANNQPSKARDELNGMVISAELTLISIIQGTALYFLVNTSFEFIVNLQFQYWPYTAAGLLVIFIVWSRSLMHIFTMIQWPLEFGHNFLYIAITLIEAIMFTQQLNPQRWFLSGIAFWFLAWVTFAFDMRMIHRLKAEAKSEKFRELLAITEKEQLLNIRILLPLTTFFYLLVSWAIMHWADTLIAGKGHVFFALLQLLGLLGYLIYSLNFYTRVTPLILASRQELNNT